MIDDPIERMLATQNAELKKLMVQLDSVEVEDRYEFVRVVLAVGSCLVNKKNHGVFILVENEDAMKVMSVNASLDEAGFITTQAADMFISNEVGKELQRKGETH